MGSCISKCKPKRKFKEDCSHVHDKLVISQDPPTSSVPPTMPLEKPFSPAPSTSSTASFSSFSCSTNTKCSTMASSISSSSSLSSSSSSSSCSSSLLKDKSFSNEFLRSCLKDNPHIVGLKGKIQEQRGLCFNKIQYSPNPDPSSLFASPIASKTKQAIQEKEKLINNVPTPKKRARAGSPTLVRQKSFRKEDNSVGSMPNRGIRSPSRFNGENTGSFSTNGTFENTYKRPLVSKGNAVSSATSALKRESFRAPSASPNREFTIRSNNFSVRKRDTFSPQINTKSDGHVAAGETKTSQEMDVTMEDINNPLIALDCFIFL